MKTKVYQCLRELHERHGPREFGKICQKLLAIAFRSAGCTDIAERGVQGVDLDVKWADGRKLSIEVKTTTERSIQFEAKDVAGLRARGQQDGYVPVLAVLRIHALYAWCFARAELLRAGAWPVDRLRAYRWTELESEIDAHFDAAVCEHFDATLTGAQAYLDGVLRASGICTVDP